MFAKVLQPFFGAFIGQYIIMNAAQFKINNNYQRTDAGSWNETSVDMMCPKGTRLTMVSVCKVWDARIKIFKKATEENAAIVYRYCNPYKHKLFILTNETDPCTLRLNKLCPARMDRLSDCSCAEKCKEGWVRDPMGDFKCKLNDTNIPIHSNKQTIPTNIEENFQVTNLTVSAHYSNLRVAWCVAIGAEISLKHIELTYRASGNATINDMPNLHPEGDCQCHDVRNLMPGKKYIISLSFMIRYFYTDDVIVPVKMLKSGVTTPKPVEELNATLTGKTVTLEWYIPVNCHFDKFLVEEKGNVIEAYDTRYSVTLSDAFPGEKYTWRVSTISNGVKSSTREVVIILPPLPPDELHEFLVRGGDLDSEREIIWFKNDAMSKVEGYYVSYNSTAAGISRRDIYVAVPYAQNKIRYQLVDLKPGMQYDITVISQVDGVNSTYPTRRLISIPYDDVVKDTLLFALICMIVLLLYLLVKQYDALVSSNNNNKAPEKVHIVNKKYGNITKIRSKHVTANINKTDDNIPPDSPAESSEDEI
ncbi:uncharacterized protein LOC132739255 [Ruditapes philippinarum]|uniref:uncharacterized protein LOC132739255 n=1 Tax=Ruditapes philippinarum TaxID=129788 RepID=UPI00295A9745|nr:uncharacterized protein LOC132739255 [Ruditapes philippinarum]